MGKSTVSVNLAAALAARGHRVGVMDADIYGPNMPRMFGLVGQEPLVSAEKRIQFADALHDFVALLWLEPGKLL